MAIDPQLKPDSASTLSPQEAKNWWMTTSGTRAAFEWAIALALGMISISFAPSDSKPRLIIPILVLFFYAWASYRKTESLAPGLRSARIAQLADSAYFLGFLWTLWALIDSLVLKHASSAEAAFRAFGYALVTTAFGMATRLYLVQFKYGAGEQEIEAEKRIETALQMFANAMNDASRSAQAFQKIAIALNSSVEGLTGSITNIDKQFEKTHRETVNAISENITTVVDEIKDKLKSPVQEYGRSIRGFTASVNTQSDVLSRSLYKWSEDLHGSIILASTNAQNGLKETALRIAVEHGTIATQIMSEAKQIIEELQRLSQHLKTIALPTHDIQTLGTSVSELQVRLGSLATILDSDGQVTVNFKDFSEKLATKTASITETLTILNDKLGDIAVPTEVTVNVHDTTKALVNLRQSTEELLRVVNDPRWEKAPLLASDAIFKLTEKVNNLRDSLEKADKGAPKFRWWGS